MNIFRITFIERKRKEFLSISNNIMKISGLIKNDIKHGIVIMEKLGKKEYIAGSRFITQGFLQKPLFK